jgi:hypothetical protein
MPEATHRWSVLRRWLASLAVAASGASLAACGGSSPSASPTTPAVTGQPATTAVPATTVPATTAATAAPTTAAPTTVPSGPQPCTTAQLSLSLTGANGAAGSTYFTLNLLNNTTATTCTVTGYPGVSFVTGDGGTQVGTAATRDPSTPVATVTLAPGHAAQSVLRVVDPGVFDTATCQPVATRGLRIYPPGQTAAGFVADPSTACSSASLPEPALFVGAAQPGPAAGGIGPASAG